MHRKGAVYGFQWALPDYPGTIATLGQAIKDFAISHAALVEGSQLHFAFDDDGQHNYVGESTRRSIHQS